jgi:hypothetical protein
MKLSACLCSFLTCFFDPEDKGYVPLNHIQNTSLFTVAAVRTSDPASICLHFPLRMRDEIIRILYRHADRLCGLVVRVLGYSSGGPGSIPGTTELPEKKSNGSGTESTQPREYN